MNNKSVLTYIFFKTDLGNEPLKKWLSRKKNFTENERKVIMADINAVRQDWKLCLNKQLVKSLEQGLWEIRSRLSDRSVRIFFTRKDNLMVLLHGFVKKTQEIPKGELKTARKRGSQWHKEDRRK